MSEPNVELAHRLTELLIADDPQGAAEFFAPDAELKMRLGTYVGHAGVAEWQQAVRDFLGAYEFIESEYLEAGDVVLHLARVRAQGHAGTEIEQDYGFLMRFEDGKVVAAESYPSRDEALAAADLAGRGAAGPLT